MPAGQKLKTLRNNRNITVREVERASRRIAEAKGDKRFRISNGWLAQLEKGVSEPSICKIFSLSVIYQVQFFDLIRLYDVDINEIEKYAPVANPTLTQLLAQDIGNHDRLARVIPVSGPWHSEFERPIYFMELRDGYACGWCELNGNQLLIIPHHLSPASIRRFTYPREAEIVGRVTGYNTYCIDPEPQSLEAAKEQKVMRAKSIRKSG